MASECSVYDHLLMEVLQGERQIVPFLDVVFSFLYRRTDFYKLLHNDSETMGFPPGYAENLVRCAFLRYHDLALQDEEEYQRKKLMETADGDIPPALSIVELSLNDKSEEPTRPDQASPNQSFEKPLEERTQKDFQNCNESYNGAQREKYSWSQNSTDIDIHIPVPKHIKSAQSVKVHLTKDHLKVSISDGTPECHVDCIDDDLLHSVVAEDVIWNLFPGEHIFISMEKTEHRWWDCLLKTEPKINVNEIDNSQPFEELDDLSQAKIQQLMFDERQKAAGKPTSDEMKIESTLKQAWNMEGSPFKDKNS